MRKHESSKAQARTGGMTIGRKRFAAISAVDGIKLTPEMERRAAEFGRNGLTPDERIRVIVTAHRKAQSP
jgi:hypothetical protein